MRNYEALRGGHPPRDIYGELLRIEERGQRIKNRKKPWLSSLLGSKKKTPANPSETI